MSGGFKPPGRLRLILDWAFDWFMLPVIEALRKPSPDEGEKEKPSG